MHLTTVQLSQDWWRPGSIGLHGKWNTGPAQLSTLHIISSVLADRAAAPVLALASDKMADDRGEETVKSNVAGFPLSQLPTKTSAGRELSNVRWSSYLATTERLTKWIIFNRSNSDETGLGERTREGDHRLKVFSKYNGRQLLLHGGRNAQLAQLAYPCPDLFRHESSLPSNSVRMSNKQETCVCEKCSEEIPIRSKFCPECGAQRNKKQRVDPEELPKPAQGGSDGQVTLEPSGSGATPGAPSVTPSDQDKDGSLNLRKRRSAEEGGGTEPAVKVRRKGSGASEGSEQVCGELNDFNQQVAAAGSVVLTVSVMLASPGVLVRTSTSDCVVQDSDIIACTVLFSAMVWGDVLLEQLAMSVGIVAPLALDLGILFSSTCPVLYSSTCPVLFSSTCPVLFSSMCPVLFSSMCPVFYSSTCPVLFSSTCPVLYSFTCPVLFSSTCPVLSVPLVQSSSVPLVQSSSVLPVQSSSVPLVQSSQFRICSPLQLQFIHNHLTQNGQQYYKKTLQNQN
eukprot:Em0016g510a